MRCAYPPYAGTFLICWSDEILNMIVKRIIRSASEPDVLGLSPAFGENHPDGFLCLCIMDVGSCVFASWMVEHAAMDTVLFLYILAKLRLRPTKHDLTLVNRKVKL